MILPGSKNAGTRVDPQHLGKSEWDQMLGKIDCVFSLYDKMRWKWDDVNLPRVSGMCTSSCSVHHRYTCISIRPLLLINDVPGGIDQASWGMHFEAEIKWTQRYTWRPGSSNFSDALGDRDWVNSEMHWEAVIERVWRCTCRLRSTAIGGVLGSGWFGVRRDSCCDSIH